jgi:ribonuclease-3
MSDALMAALGVALPRDLLQQALTHRSYAYEHGGLPTNERLEFLGDAVLGVIVTDTIYRRYPDWSEGQLAKLRSAVVSSQALATLARQLGVGDDLLLGRGEEGSGGRDKSSILADTLEALIGAVFLTCGTEVTHAVLTRLFDPLIEQAATLGAGLDWKTSLQEAAAASGLGSPDYIVMDEGPDHEKTFFAQVLLGGVLHGSGTGRSKKLAEQQAAAAAYESLVGKQ